MSCLCGHGEWCSWCSPDGFSPRADEIYARIKGYVKCKANNSIYSMSEQKALNNGYPILPLEYCGPHPEKFDSFLKTTAREDPIIIFLLSHLSHHERIPFTWIKRLVATRADELYEEINNPKQFFTTKILKINKYGEYETVSVETKEVELENEQNNNN